MPQVEMLVNFGPIFRRYTSKKRTIEKSKNIKKNTYEQQMLVNFYI